MANEASIAMMIVLELSYNEVSGEAEDGEGDGVDG